MIDSLDTGMTGNGSTQYSNIYIAEIVMLTLAVIVTLTFAVTLRVVGPGQGGTTPPRYVLPGLRISSSATGNEIDSCMTTLIYISWFKGASP
jgi:hypothetical protein